MPETTTAAETASVSAVEERVLEVVQGLALELGGPRAQRAAALHASLEREVGLGSLERVELLLRLEAAFGRSLDDGCLALDTAAELARAVLASGEPSSQETLDPAPRLAEARALPEQARTLHEALWLRAHADPDRPHVFMREDDGREHTITYGGLLAAARGVAGALREGGVARGDAVALMLPTGGDFLAAFQGVLLAGAIPVPIYPPVRLDRIEEYALRQAAILADASAVALITIARALPIAALLRPRVPSLRRVTTVAELAAVGADWARPEGAASDPAFIQYTSGSTGSPKGVLLSHANLLANIDAIAAGLRATPSDVGVSWLPLYHDMGLIGSWLFCLQRGLPIDVQSPLAFLARPERWLWAIHRRRATLSAAPNFAYELCVRRVPDAALQELDLSSWRCALNGAEPVNPDTLERFASRFARCGFRREALMPVYGLAENSVALCFPPVGRGPRVDRVAREPFERERKALPAGEDSRALAFVSAGTALPAHAVRVVDDAGDDVPERVVGRLLFRGPSATAGYFRNPAATEAMRRGDWLDSGDLAYLANGEVHVTGRVKDLIIKAGRNLVPQEIEEAAAGVAGIRRGCIAAIGVAQATLGTESLIVVAETRATQAEARDRLAAAVTEAVALAVGVPPDAVVLVPPGAVPKTSSGKVRRAATRELYVSGQLGSAPRTSLATRARLVIDAARHALRPAPRAVGRALYAAYLGVMLPLVALPAWLLIFLAPSVRFARAASRVTARVALWLAGYRIEVEGLRHLDAPGPLLLASNHASYIDIPLLAAVLPRSFAFVAKHEVMKWPLVPTLVRRGGHLTVDRWDGARGVADAGLVARRVEEGGTVLLFAEGTFVAAAGLRPFRLGAFKTAVQTDTPVVPIALRGTRQALRAGTWLPRPVRVRVSIGAPIAPSGSDWRAVVLLRDRVVAAIAAACGEPVLDLVAGGPERTEAP